MICERGTFPANLKWTTSHTGRSTRAGGGQTNKRASPDTRLAGSIANRMSDTWGGVGEA